MATEVAQNDGPGLTANWMWIADAPGMGQALSGVGEPAQRLILAESYHLARPPPVLPDL